jgi:hypothetical protein
VRSGPGAARTTSYFFIPLVLGPRNSLVWYVPSSRYTRALVWRIHRGLEVTESRSSARYRESVLFIGIQFSNLYTGVDTPARGRVVVCLVFVCLVFVCKYVFGHSRVSQPLNLRLCFLRHLGFLTSPYASPTCRRRRLNSYRLLRRSTPDPPPLFHVPISFTFLPRPDLHHIHLQRQLN